MSKSSENVKRWRERSKIRMVESMGGICVCCGYSKCSDAFEFHHLNPEEKEFSIGNIRANIVSWKRITDELKKCIMVCSNCHKEIHNGMTDIPTNVKRFDEKFVDYKPREVLTPCQVCGKDKPEHLITCSRRCRSARTWSIDWSVVNLKDEIKTKSIRKIASEIGVSAAAVTKRMQKLGIC